jgi:hypothetical protein
MYEVYKQTLMEEIQNVNFVSIQADETTDISCMSVILLQYVKRDGPVERFNSFVQVQNRTAEGLASVLKQELALAFLSIHKDVIADTWRFIQKVIKSCLHLRKIEEDNFFINKVTFNEFIIPHNFHELP